MQGRRGFQPYETVRDPDPWAQPQKIFKQQPSQADIHE